MVPMLSFIDEYYDSTEILSNIKDFDYLIYATPVTKYTKGLINKEFLNNMKQRWLF